MVKINLTFYQELIRHTPENHPDYDALQSAFNKINEVVININEGQREAEGMQRVLELQKQIEGFDVSFRLIFGDSFSSLDNGNND